MEIPSTIEALTRIGDQMLHSVEAAIPDSIEEFLAGSIARFIKLAALDSGYSKPDTKLLLTKWVHPLFLKAKLEASKKDNPNWRQAMNGPFADDFWKAAVKEFTTLENMKAWEVVDRPPLAKVLDIIWVFKIKRFPDGLIKAFKGRLCTRGDQQIEGVDFFETYAPVVQWTTIRLMPVLKVHTCRVFTRRPPGRQARLH